MGKLSIRRGESASTESLVSPDVTLPIVGLGALARMGMSIDCASRELISNRTGDMLLCTVDVAKTMNFGWKILLEQMWDLKVCRGVQVDSDTSTSIFVGKSVFLPQKEWVRVFLTCKLHIEGGVTVVCGIQSPGFVAGLAVTKGGQLRLNTWNSKE